MIIVNEDYNDNEKYIPAVKIPPGKAFKAKTGEIFVSCHEGAILIRNVDGELVEPCGEIWTDDELRTHSVMGKPYYKKITLTTEKWDE